MTNLLPRFLTFLLFCVLSTGLSFAQGGVCADIEPFCAGDQALIFPNCNNQDPNCTPTAEPGPNYGCLYSQPWPAWFYLQIDQPGRLEFEIIQNTQFDANGNPTGTGLDVDFIAWGPFQPGDDYCDYANLQSHNEIACSYSAAPIENFTIPNAQTGEIYVLLITNYNQSPGWIKLHQTNAGSQNAGSTDCTILEPPQDGCEGDEFELDATTPRGINYLWEYDDGTGYVEIYNGLFPVITVFDSGDYRATVSFLGTADQIIEFEVNAYPQPVIAEAPIDLFRCDDGGGGVRFDLTENSPIVLGGQDPAFFVTYHHSEDDAINDNDRIPDPDGYFITGNQETIWLRIANEDGGLCYAVDSFEISLTVVYATPPPSPYHLCDLDGNGQEPINLVSTFSTTILDGQSPLDVRISYHDNLGDADTGNNPLQQPYLVTTSPETIYVRAESRADTNCYEVVDFQIVLDLPPVVNPTPSPLVVCDLDNDGYAPFYLHDADVDISLGDPTLIITYHGTLENAELNIDELPEPYVNDDPWSDVVYARIEDPDTDCYATTVLPLEVRLTPELVDPTPLILCEDAQGSGTAVFNLTIRELEMLDGSDPTDYDFYYYEDQAEAIIAGDLALTAPDFSAAIGSPTTYTNTSNPQTIYVLAVGSTTFTVPFNGGEGCYDIVELELIVEDLPVPIQPEPYELCDDLESGSDTDQRSYFNLTSRNAEITDGDTTLTVTWFETFADEAADIPIADPTAYLNTTTPQTVVARVTNVADCHFIVTLTLIVNPVPDAAAPTPLVACGGSNGYAQFTLTDKDDEIANGNLDLTISYHGTFEDAQNNQNILAIPHTNTTPWNDVVYARVVDIVTGCMVVVELPLEVRISPNLTTPTPLVYCEDMQGSGTAVFDLRSKEAEMLDGSDPTHVDFYYYEDQADAIIAGDLALTNPNYSAAIVNPAAYTNIANPQIVYVLAVGTGDFTTPPNGGEGCYDIVELELIVEEEPVPVQPAPYELCDDIESGSNTDQRSYFNLTSRNAEITDGDTTLTVTWFETFADEANDTPIADPTAYLNTATPQTVVARVSSIADCRALVTLTLRVNPVPDAVEPTPLVACGGSNGYAQFTLTDKDDEIANGNPDLTISYHGTLEDAQNNQNILAIPYTNTTPWNDVVYARVVDGVTGCLVIVELPLEVRTSPNLTTPTPLVYCEDMQGSGTAVFDLRSKEAEMLDGSDPTHVDFYYYEDQADAIIAGDLALTNPNYSAAIVNPAAYTNIANPQIVYVLAVGTGDFTTPPNGGEGCYDIVELELIVEEEPVPVQPAPYELCDDIESGSTTDQRSYFDLTSRNAEITDGDTTLTVTWFETFADEANDTPIADPTAYLNTATPQTVVARVSSAADCRALVTLTLIVNPVPDAVAPTPLIACDGGTSGYAQFYLTDKDDEIANGNPDLTISYHGTLEDAQNNQNILAIPYTNTTPWNDVVYARVVDGVTGCLVIVELPLEVRLSPDLTTPTPLVYCEDMQGSGTAVFDLRSKEAEMLDGTDPSHVDFYYYEDQADAIIAGDLALTNPNYSAAIVNPAAYTNIANPQIVYVLAVGTGDFTTPPNGGEGCYDIVELELIVEEEPAPVQPAPYELCDDLESGSDTDQTSYFDLTSRNAEITDGDTTLTVTWFETFADEANDTPIADPTAYLNTATPQTVVARVSSAADCRALVTLTLIVNPVPNAIAPTPLVVCDADNEGYAYFTLTDKDEEISGGNPAILVSYHETEIDALNGVFPLASPFQNIVAGGQTIYARAFFADPPSGTGCFTVVPLELIVSPTPEIPVELPDLVECDIDGNGFAVFDLTQQDELIYGSQDPTQFDLTYHRTLAEAEQGIGAINNPDAFTNETNPQDIYARLGFNTGDACYAIGKFTLIVAPAIPINDPEPLELCTPLGEPNTGTAIFDLTVKDAEITGGAAGLGVRYFLTEEDAQANENWITPATAFENTENPQRIYVRVIDTNSECAAFTSLLLRVLPNPEPVTPTPIELCDADNSGTAEFDLTIREAEILNGEDWVLSYFETYNDAVADENAIADPEQYENIENPQIIYVRVTNEDSGCFEIVELELIVRPIANVNNEITPYLICEINTTGVATFDLTTKIPEILGDLPPADYLVTFYLSQIDAANGENPILDPEVHQNRDWNGDIVNPQTIYVGVGIPGTDCYVGGLMDFDILVQEAAIATEPAEPFVVCDNLPPSDGIAEFDLEDLNDPAVVALREEILSGQDPTIYSLAFYETLEQAEAGEDAIVFPYLNVVNPQVIYARVTNEDNLYEPRCNSIVEVILKVTEMPAIVFDQDEYRLCVDGDGNPIEEEFGEMSPPVIDTYLDPNLYTFVWMLNGEVLPGETGAFIIPSAGGVYTVTATDMATGCVTSGEVTVWLSSPPIVYDATIIKVSPGVFTIEVFADGLGVYEYQLNDGPFQDSATFTNVELGPGAHYVTIRDKNGCGYVILELGIIDYPLYFTPNNDGYHDTWNIHGIGVVDPSATIYIFDRYGKLLKQLSPTGPGWDGTYNGQEMPSTDYWFRADYIENGSRKQLKGHFTLKR